MAASLVSHTSGARNGAGTVGSQATGVITPTANRLQLIAFLNTDTSGANQPNPPGTVAANGLTYTQTGAAGTFPLNLGGGTLRTVYVTTWRAVGASPSASAATATFPTGQTDIYWSAVEGNSEVDASGVNGANGIVQHVPLVGTASPLTINLAAFSSPNNLAYGAFGEQGDGTFGVGTGFTLIHNADGQNVLLTEQKLNDASVDATYTTGGVWAGIALEIKAAVAATGINPAQRRQRGIGY